MADDSFFEGLDDAEDVPAPVAETPAAAPEAAAKPAEASAETEKAPEAAAKPAEKPAEVAPVIAPPAEKPAEKPVVAEQPDPRKWVPVGAHVELRDQLKALRSELDALKNPPKPKPAEPDFIADPKGYVDTKVASALEQLENATKPVRETAERADAAATAAQIQQTLSMAEQSFAAQTPDYQQALTHIRNLREAELTMLHPDVPIQQIRQFMSQEEMQLAVNLMRNGRNPAEVAYGLAKARGYSPPKPAEAQKPELKPAAPEKVAELVPKVPEPVKLAPDLTLGTGAGSPATGTDIEEDPFDAAFKEVFGRKRA